MPRYLIAQDPIEFYELKIAQFVLPVSAISRRVSDVAATTQQRLARVRNIQLVTPALTHWFLPASSRAGHSGHIGVLKLQIVPEPSAIMLLATGVGVIPVLHGLRRRE